MTIKEQIKRILWSHGKGMNDVYQGDNSQEMSNAIKEVNKKIPFLRISGIAQILRRNRLWVSKKLKE